MIVCLIIYEGPSQVSAGPDLNITIRPFRSIVIPFVRNSRVRKPIKSRQTKLAIRFQIFCASQDPVKTRLWNKSRNRNSL
jgi:hypothetical protein